MNLENVTVELRPRTEWEAVELGTRMVRRDAAAIYRTWFQVTLPAIFVVGLVTWFTNWGGLALLVYWWLEPVTDGPVLRIIARHLFGEEPDARGALRSVFSTAWRNKRYWLTPYRFHFARSAMLPITQLEGLGGERRKNRSRTIGSRIFTHGTGVTVAYQHLVIAVYLGAILFVYMLMPESFRDAHGESWLEMFYTESSKVTEILNLALFYLAQTALHPWFVGAGFGLYINCRTQLEAWDIEVAFRRMVQRRAAMTAVGVVLACFIGLSVLSVPQAEAAALQEQEAAVDDEDPGFDGFWSEDDVKKALDAAYEQEALDRWETVERWEKITTRPERQRNSSSSDSAWLGDLFDGIANAAAIITEFALWIVVALVLAVIYMTREAWMPFLQGEILQAKRQRRIVLADGHVDAESLPDNVPAEVLRVWREGRKRDALSLFYRASVFAAVVRHDIQLPDSATEGTCLRAVRKVASDDEHRFFRRIVTAWSLCAYASRLIDEQTLARLCDDWPVYYEAHA